MVGRAIPSPEMGQQSVYLGNVGSGSLGRWAWSPWAEGDAAFRRLRPGRLGRRRAGGDQAGMGETPLVRGWAGRGHGDLHATCADTSAEDVERQVAAAVALVHKSQKK